jgi:hypothetical protein
MCAERASGSNIQPQRWEIPRIFASLKFKPTPILATETFFSPSTKDSHKRSQHSTTLNRERSITNLRCGLGGGSVG